ncbi:UNVERIFIED_CONTAM: hypothetical protein PYX00_007244 [Menopon gallinae]|uniref:dihydropyrimidinase n=1 Tax=Menopon gallinae TaxID=328185 RepID=A0AAW2HJ33_9NEOP
MSATPVKKVPIHLQSSQNRLLIKNGKIVNADGISDGDIFIEDGIIKELGRNLIIPGGTRAIDAKGKYVFPGGIDPHTHFDFQLMGPRTIDDFYQGTKAAIAGGTTTIIDFISPDKGQSLIEAYYEKRQSADEKVCCDYALHCIVNQCTDRVKQEMTELVSEEYGVNSFKFFMAYKDLMLRDTELFPLFEHCRKIGAIAQVHAENGDIIMENTKRLLESGVTGPDGHQLSRPEDVEAEAVTRAAMIANQTNCPLYVVHVMSRSAAEAVALARSRGNVLFGETLAAALGADGRAYKHECWEHAAGHVLSPPLRPDPETPETMLRFLVSNGLQLTGSDHCTFTLEQKAQGRGDFTQIPNGVNGVEERMSIIWERGVKTGLLDLPRFVEVTSTNAAKIFNIYPKKGVIAVGSDADIVVWDPNQVRTISKATHHSASNFNIFEGTQIHGAPEYVIVNGRVCVDEFELKAVQGHGKFVPTSPWCPYVYEMMKAREEKAGGQNGLSNMTPIKLTLPKIPEAPTPTPSPATNPVTPTTGRQMRQEGQRDLQGTTFSISGEKDNVVFKSGIRVHNPPGGQSSGGFW